MKKLTLFMIITSLQIFQVSTVWAEGHKLVMTNFNNDTFNMDIDSNIIGTNGSAKPGLYLHASSDKELGYDQKVKWSKKPTDLESNLLGERMVLNAQQSLPVRIIFSGNEPMKSSEAMAKLIKASPDKLQFSFDARMGESSFHPRSTLVTAFPKKEAAKSGELSFMKMEYIIPESAVTVKNLKTNQVMKLSDYIDANFDRSFTTAVKEFFNKKFNKDQSLGVADSPRDTKRPINADTSYKVPGTKKAQER